MLNKNDPWTQLETQVKQIHRTGTGLLAMVACYLRGDKATLSGRDAKEAMLGRIDQIRVRVDHIERIIQSLD